MADEPVRTEVRTDDGWLEFQEYFVHLHQGPEVREIRFDGRSRTDAEVDAAIEAAEVVVIGPSNPIVSIGPILAGPDPGAGRGALPRRRPGHRGQPDRRWRRAQGAGRPDAGLARVSNRAPGEWPGCTATWPARSSSTPWTRPPNPTIAALGLRTLVTDTIMADAGGRARLARAVLEFAGRP